MYDGPAKQSLRYYTGGARLVMPGGSALDVKSRCELVWVTAEGVATPLRAAQT